VSFFSQNNNILGGPLRVDIKSCHEMRFLARYGKATRMISPMVTFQNSFDEENGICPYFLKPFIHRGSIDPTCATPSIGPIRSSTPSRIQIWSRKILSISQAGASNQADTHT
jgi:hypothetical protein